ncbi:MAG: hypothetical protein V2J24_01725, partial [Pseudomonadales bacterium]|nr:hypothetical protein [Pseudomonadales bacterium]
MNEAQALRVLRLDAGADEAELRRAFENRLRRLRAARRSASDPDLQRRLDRALAATVHARRALLDRLRAPEPVPEPEPDPVFEPAPELRRPSEQAAPAPPSSLRWPSLLPLGVLGGALLILVAVVLRGPAQAPSNGGTAAGPAPATGSAESGAGTGASTAADPASDDGEARPGRGRTVRVAGADSERVGPVLERVWLDGARLELARVFRSPDGFLLPRTVEPSVLSELPLPRGWRFLVQRDGAVALLDDAGGWLLLQPLPEAGRLRWLCVAQQAVAGCRRARSARLAAAVGVGAADAGAVADALAPSAPELASRLASWASGVLDGRPLLADAEAAVARENFARGRDLLARAAAAFAAAGDVASEAATQGRLARLLARDASTPPADVAAAMLRCRRLVADLPQPVAACPEPREFALALEQQLRADRAGADDARWGRARWWYEQAYSEGDAYSVRALARMLALGLAGERDRERALALLEEAARERDAVSQAYAAASAAQLARLWGEGWGVDPDPEEASWWASQGARLGHVGAALRLAGAFALGSGTARDLDRARDLVAVYGAFAPLFEIAFYRNVGQRLSTGSDADVVADPEAGRPWFRRAFQLCEELAAAGRADARVELAGMYFSGEGTAKDAARAAEIYAQELEAVPVKAGNMLAWIR